MENFAPLIFKGLGWGIVHSLWMGALLYGTLMLAFQFKNWPAKTKSLLAAAALCVLFLFFCSTVLYHVVDGMEVATVATSGMDMVLLQMLDQRGSVPFDVQIEHYFPVMIACYILGVLFQLVIVLNSFRKLRMIRRQGLLDVPESWKALLANKKRQMGLRTPIAFHLSTLVDVPAVIGHLKPVILFPIALFSSINMEQVEAVLIHELAHIKRSDYLINLIKTTTETLLFFNPFVWFIGRVLEVERENACDDMVVSLTSKPIHYARTLLWLEEHRQHPSHSLVMQAVNKKKQLLHRIQRMTHMKRNDWNIKHKLAVLTLMLGCIVSLAWVKPFTADVEDLELTETHILSPAVAGTDHSKDSTRLVMFQSVDTLPSPDVSTITIIGKDGVKHTFKGYEDLPDSLKAVVDATWRHRADSLRIIYSGPEWQKKMERMQLAKEERDKITERVHRHLDSLNKLFDSKEWREEFSSIAQNGDIIRRQADSIRNHLDTAAWRGRLREYTESYRMYLDSPEGKKAREELQRKLEENKTKFTEWTDVIIQQDKITKQYLDSIRAYMESPEWKSKMDEWKQGILDTSLVWPSMTMEGPKIEIGQLSEIREQLQTLRQQELTVRQLQHIDTNMENLQRYHKVLEQHQKQYIDGSIKLRLKLIE